MLIKVWKKLMSMLFHFSLLLSFLGIIPLIIYIYYNIYYSDITDVMSGCIAILTVAYINKSIQGGD